MGGVVPAAGAGVSGEAGAGPVAAGPAAAGALRRSSTDFGAEARAPITCSRNASPRKIPPHHQLMVVRRLPAWRVPISESDEELDPPKFAASPPPFPACKRTTAMSRSASMTRSVSSRVYMSKRDDGDEGATGKSASENPFQVQLSNITEYERRGK